MTENEQSSWAADLANYPKKLEVRAVAHTSVSTRKAEARTAEFKASLCYMRNEIRPYKHHKGKKNHWLSLQRLVTLWLARDTGAESRFHVQWRGPGLSVRFFQTSLQA